MREGDRIDEYVLGRLLGRGGMGEVWRAKDTRLDRWVALKVLSKAEPAELERLRREARAAAALAHPGIVRIYAVGDRHIAMELIEGRTLADSALDERAAAVAVRDAARAIAAAHAGGIVHRDLKPQNLMRDGAGRVHVMDFGLARRVEGGESLTQTGVTLGTPAYMSPEQARGERADELTDVYGLGATLHHLLSGNPPFEGATVIAVLKGVLDREPKPTGADGELDAIVMRCLAKKRSERYAGAAELADDLDRWLKREPVVARPVSGITRVRRNLARGRAVAWTVAGALVAVGAIVGLLAWSLRRTEQDAEAVKKRLVEDLRATAATCLDAALQLRRAGNVAAMDVQAKRLEETCAQVMAALPALGEPHMQLGRMRRAQMQFHLALESQERALALEPGLVEAMRERARLLQRRYETALGERAAAWRRGRRDVRDVPDPPPVELEDADMRAWKAAALADLAKLGDDESRARARLLQGDTEAFHWFGRAAEDPGADEEVFELRGKVALDMRRFDEAVQWFTRGHERDLGYAPHLAGRARARQMAMRLRAAGDPTEPALAAVEDWNAVERLGLLDLSARHHRADAWMTLAQWRISFGGDWEDPIRRAEADFELLMDLPLVSVPINRGVIELERARAAQARGEDPLPHYRRSVERLEAAAKRHPADEGAWSNLGFVEANWAQYESVSGRDPSIHHRAALAAIDEAVRLRRSVTNLRARGKVFYNAGVHAADHGGDGAADFAAAMTDLELASKTADDRDAETLILMGNVRSRQATLQRSPEMWRRALEDFERAVAADPTNEMALVRRAGTKATLAQGVEAAMRDAQDDAERACTLRPGTADAWQMLGKIRYSIARSRAAAGRPAAEEYREAQKAFEEAVRLQASMKRELDPLIADCARYLASGRS